MNRQALRIAPLFFALGLAGCANVTLDAAPASPALVEKLRAAQLRPAQVGAFTLAAGKPASMDSGLDGLRGNSLVPAKGSWAQLLKDTLVTELGAAGLLDPASTSIIEAQLTDSKVDAPVGVGTGRLAARFTVTRSGRRVFDKELAAEATWESSFVGGVAVPEAIRQYAALYKSLAAKLIDDTDFRKALAR